MSVYEKLMNVQKELNCPKSQVNSYGKYNYRSCEDILEAVKPLLAKNKCVLFLNDEIVEVAGRVYVKVTANFIDCETGEKVVNTAYAREEESRKGMDGSQITGATSSYSRKYCMNGLFCIDDTKDVDTDEYQNNGKKETKAPVKKSVEKKQDTAEDGGKGAVILAQIPPQTQVLNNKGQYVTLDSLSVEVLRQIKGMKMYQSAWADIAAVLSEKGAA